MRLEVQDLDAKELDLVVWVLRICTGMQPKIANLEDENSPLGSCGCLVHYAPDTTSSQIKRAHDSYLCSLDESRDFIRELLGGKDLVEEFVHKMREGCPTLLKCWVSKKWKDGFHFLNNEEILLMIRVLKICWKCGLRAEMWDMLRCGCIEHSHNDCKRANQLRIKHPTPCTNEFKSETVGMLKQTWWVLMWTKYFGDFSDWFRCGMRHAFPRIMRALLEPRIKSLGLEMFSNSELKNFRYVGHGGYGSVFVVDTEKNGILAVKKDLSIDFTDDEKNEILQLAKVSKHQNIVKIRGILFENLDSISNYGFPCGFLMEYLPGGSLDKVIFNPSVNYEDCHIFNWIRQISCGLMYLHRKEIIHRDIKPANMLLSHDLKQLKLCDLGSSRIERTMNTAGTGTAAFMAPEVGISAERATYSDSCDIYSVGISVWVMVHRKKPYPKLHEWCIVPEVQKGKRPEIDEEHCNEVLVKIMRGAWCQRPAERTPLNEISELAAKSLGDMENFWEFVKS